MPYRNAARRIFHGTEKIRQCGQRQHQLNAEAEKLKAEARKINVEAEKIEKDLKYYFFTTLSIIAGIITTIYNIVKGLN